MTHEQYLLFDPKCKEKISAAEETNDNPSVKLYSNILAKLAQHDLDEPMSFEEAIDLASDVGHDKDLCAIIDSIMGFKDGESATQVQYPISIRGTVKEWKKPQLGLRMLRQKTPLETLLGKQSLVLAECSTRECDVPIPDKYKDLLGSELTILPDNYGYGPDGFLGHTEYLTITLKEIKTKTGSCIVVGSLLDFREFADGHTEYLNRIRLNLTEAFEDAHKKIPKPRLDRIAESANRDWFGHRWQWIS